MIRIVRIVIRRKKIGNCICYLSCDVAYKEVDSKTSLWTIYVMTISFALDNSLDECLIQLVQSFSVIFTKRTNASRKAE